jgi:hypothetical protein
LSGLQILVVRGAGVECEVREGGVTDNNDIGFHEPDEPGLYIIDFVSVEYPSSYESMDGGGVEYKDQKIRSLTDEEWGHLRKGGPKAVHNLWKDVESWEQYQRRVSGWCLDCGEEDPREHCAAAHEFPPCVMCAKRLVNLGNVKQVFYAEDYRLHDAIEVLNQCGIGVVHLIPLGKQVSIPA